MKALLHILTLTLAFSGVLNAVEPVNDKCPVCGKNGRLISHSNYKGERIIFDTGDCQTPSHPVLSQPVSTPARSASELTPRAGHAPPALQSQALPLQA